METPGVSVFTLNQTLSGEDLRNVIDAMKSKKNTVVLTEIIRHSDGTLDEVKISIKGLHVNLK